MSSYIFLLVGWLDVGWSLLMSLLAPKAENRLPNPADEGRLRHRAVDIGLSVYRPINAPLFPKLWPEIEANAAG